MKVRVTQENLSKAVSGVSRVIGSATTLPVLANILLTTDKNRLKLSATNLEIGVHQWIGCKVEAEGAITVPARLFAEFVNSLPVGNVNLELDKTTLHVSTDNYSSHINGINAEEFPSIPVIEKEAVLKLDSALLRDALAQIVLVASRDEARPVLGGIYVFTDQSKLVLAATDSYRLAERVINLEPKSKPSEPLSLLLPVRTMAELQKMLSDFEGPVEIFSDEGQAMFRFGETEVVSRLIDGQFPEYKELLPKTSETTFTTYTDELLGVAKTAMLFARENAGSVTLSVDSESNAVELKSIASQVGDSTTRVEAAVEGNDAEITLNCRYIIDALGVLGSKEVAIGITGKVNPCLLKPVGETSKNYTHIIMPLRA